MSLKWAVSTQNVLIQQRNTPRNWRYQIQVSLTGFLEKTHSHYFIWAVTIWNHYILASCHHEKLVGYIHRPLEEPTLVMGVSALEHWKKVVWSDESGFHLYDAQGHVGKFSRKETSAGCMIERRQTLKAGSCFISCSAHYIVTLTNGVAAVQPADLSFQFPPHPIKPDPLRINLTAERI